MFKNKCCLYVSISIQFFSITICNLLIELPSYFVFHLPSDKERDQRNPFFKIIKFVNLPAKIMITANENKSGYVERNFMLIGMSSLILFFMTLPMSLSM
jgi:hypothetical protein